jgi:hypothetical protein
LNLQGAGNENHCSRCSSIIRPNGHSGKRQNPECRKDDSERNRLLQFARKLKPDDEIVIEASGNTSAIVRLLSPLVARVVIANPILVRAIAWAKVKTDKIDAAVLAKLHASGFLPEVWIAGRRDRDAPSSCGRTDAARLPADPSQEPDPVGSARQPHPASICVVRVALA